MQLIKRQNWIICLVVMLGVMYGITLNLHADEAIPYLEARWEDNQVKYTERYTSDYTQLSSSVIELGEAGKQSWYVAKGEITYTTNRITANGIVNLVLCDGCTLSALFGIEVGENSTLNIFGQGENSGIIQAIRPNDYTKTIYYSGIGGSGSENGDGGNAGTINIYGGTISATGGSFGAGIGGGGSKNGDGGSGGVINIYGGTVSATGGSYGAGIGGGGAVVTEGGTEKTGGSGGIVNIYGGTITAEGGLEGAGIGGGGSINGSGGDGGTVNNYGGK